MWMIENPKEGVKVPDDLPYKEILDIAKPYLGPFVSQPVDWNPTKNRVDHNLFEKYRKKNPVLDEENKWQFSTFLIAK